MVKQTPLMLSLSKHTRYVWPKTAFSPSITYCAASAAKSTPKSRVITASTRVPSSFISGPAAANAPSVSNITAAKQALLEADSLGARCELLVQLMQFFGRRDGDDGRVTLQ